MPKDAINVEKDTRRKMTNHLKGRCPIIDGHQRYHFVPEDARRSWFPKIPFSVRKDTKKGAQPFLVAKIPFTIHSNPEKWESDLLWVTKDTKKPSYNNYCRCQKRPFSSPKIPQERWPIITKWKVSNHCWSPKIPFSSQKIPDNLGYWRYHPLS